MAWLVNDWFAQGHKAIDGAPEGGCKTTFGAWLSVCIASDTPFFGHKVSKGQVLIIDEESSEDSLKYTLDRFSQGIGYQSHKELPIVILSMQGFRIGRKNDYVLDAVKVLQPVFIRLDSFIAMLPGGRQGLGETNSDVGIATRDTINSLLHNSPDSSILLSAHSKKSLIDWSVQEFINQTEMTAFVRGHGSIVGEACDTGFAIKKISDNPLRFIIKTIARRQPAPPMSSELVYVQMEEEAYGKGKARLIQTPPVSEPPSKLVKELFKLFKDGQEHSWEAINKQSALYTRKQNQQAIEELARHKIILNGRKPFIYYLNRNYKKEAESDYLRML